MYVNFLLFFDYLGIEQIEITDLKDETFSLIEERLCVFLYSLCKLLVSILYRTGRLKKKKRTGVNETIYLE